MGAVYHITVISGIQKAMKSRNRPRLDNPISNSRILDARCKAMSDVPYPWPRNSWAILSKIIRAWYSVETGDGEVTQKKIAEVAGVQQSQVSVNKAFLQAIGVVSQEGTTLTESGKRLGIGLYNENENMRRQGLEQVIKATPVLRDTLEIVRGRGSLKTDDFYDEVALRLGGKTEGFTTGTSILLQLLTLSGGVEIKDNTIRPLRVTAKVQLEQIEKEKPSTVNTSAPDLHRIPIPVSTNSVWYIEVGKEPKEGEVERFLAMQNLMFGIK
jgi:hypothetical protein